ncbi:reverse transcriptase domain-containing protein [Tanacetum coccineum]
MDTTLSRQNNTFKNELRNELSNYIKNMMSCFFQMNTASSSGSGSLPSNTVANPRGVLKAITTRSGVSYDGPPIPHPFSPFPKVVEREPEMTKDTLQLKLTLRVDDEAITFKVGQTSRYSYNDAESVNRIDVIDVSCEEYAQEVLGFSNSSTSGNPTPSLDPILSTSFPSLTPFEGGDFILEEIEACLTNDSIPPGIDDADFDPEGDLLLLEKLLNDDPSFPLPLKELHFEEIKTIKSSIDDPPELELKDLPSHLENLPPIPPPFSILFPGGGTGDPKVTMDNGIAEDVFVKVGKFHFPADFVVIDYVVDPRVPLILGRPFLRMARTLIDVYGEELTLRVDDEAITFKVGQTSRYFYNDAESVNRIDVIDVSCEEYAQEVLRFSDSSTSGNLIPSLDPILSTSFSSLTPFEGGDFILEEIKACLTNDLIPPGIDDANFDPEGDLFLLEKLLNDDPSFPLPPKELHFEEIKTIKSYIDGPPELELKDLLSHFEYAFLNGIDKLPVIISKELKDEEKTALLKVLKSHKRAIA